MMTATQSIQQTLTNLLEICHDGEKAFTAAANALGADEPLLRSELMQYSYQRREFAADLQLELERAGELEPPDHGTISGTLHRGWLNLKQAVLSASRHSVLAECERGEDVAMEAYRKALASGLPGSINDLVTVQFQAISRVHDRIRMLRDSVKSN